MKDVHCIVETGVLQNGQKMIELVGAVFVAAATAAELITTVATLGHFGEVIAIVVNYVRGQNDLHARHQRC